MTIYLDKDYKCHMENDGTMTAVETDAFEGKCREYIEGFRFVPEGCTWTREDGKEFQGEMIAPWKPFRDLAYAQVLYELEQVRAENKVMSADIGALNEQLADMQAAYAEGVASA